MSALRPVDRILNIVTVAIVITIATVVAYRHFPRPAELPDGPSIGQQLEISGLRTKGYHSTLVMVLSLDCRYCRESAPFYRQLASRKASEVNIVAVFPEPVALTRSYLIANGIPIQDVRQENPRKLNVRGNPTLILCDNSGRVQSIWAGELPPIQAREVLESVIDHGPIQYHTLQGSAHASRTADDSSDWISGPQLRQLLQREKVLPIIDIRLREDYGAAHISDAVNIPIDELRDRAPHEIPRWPTIIMYCYYCPHCDASSSPEGVTSSCRVTKLIMNNMGYANLKLLKDPLPQLEKDGIKVSKSGGSATLP